MLVGLRGDHRLLQPYQELLRLGQRQPPRFGISPRSRGGLISITSTSRPSVSVSTSRKTHPVHDPPAGNGPTGHIASVLIPVLNTPRRSTVAITKFGNRSIISTIDRHGVTI